MATTVPTLIDGVDVVAAAVLARGSTLRGTIDLRADFGCWLSVAIGRGGTTALSGGTTPGVDVLVRRLLNNGTATAGAMRPRVVSLLSLIAAAAGTTVDADSASAQNVLNVLSTTGFAAGDDICIQDSGAGVTRLEWARVSKVTNPGASGELVLDRNLDFSHTAAQADTVRNKADIFNAIWLPGLSLYEVVFDYGDDTGGESVTVHAVAQRYDLDTTT